MDQRSLALLEFPARPGAARGGHLVRAVAPAGRGARAVRRPGHRRARARRDRPGAGAHRGAAGRRDRGGPRHRPGDRAGGAWRPPRAGPVPRDRRHARCDRAAGDVARRRAPAAAARARARAPRPAGAALDAGPQLRPGRASCSTRPRRGSAACGPRSGSPTTGCGGGSTRSSARSSAARSRSRSSRCATAATWCRSRPRRGRGSRASSTTRRAAARRCSSSRSSRSSSATPGARRRSPRPRRSRASSTSCRRSWPPTRRPLRETLDALARFDLWAAKASLAADMDGVAGRDRRSSRGRPAVGPPPGPDRPRRADRHPPRRRLHARSS